jgi:hypothetical protein
MDAGAAEAESVGAKGSRFDDSTGALLSPDETVETEGNDDWAHAALAKRRIVESDKRGPRIRYTGPEKLMAHPPENQCANDITLFAPCTRDFDCFAKISARPWF